MITPLSLSGPDPPTDLVAELDVNDPSSLTYIFSWTPPLDIFILSYTVSCTPNLIGVDTVVSTVPMTTTTITLRHGLSYVCCVIASNDAGPSNQTCLSGDPITTSDIGTYIHSYTYVCVCMCVCVLSLYIQLQRVFH